MQKRQKKKAGRRGPPVDEGRLVMDAIYGSRSLEVQGFYRQVIEEEDARAAERIECGGTWSVSDYLNRVHMRMGQRFFHLLSPLMQQRFRQEYPMVFIGNPLSFAGGQLATVA